MESDMCMRALVEARIFDDDMLKRLRTKAHSMEEKAARIVVEKVQGISGGLPLSLF